MAILRAGEVNIHYKLTGLALAEPVVFISGLGADWTNWNNQLNAFQDKYLCLAFDNRDAGLSDNSPTQEYEIKNMARDTIELTYALGLDYAHYVGHSMGGAIAQEIAIRYPERVASLTLVSTFARLEPLGIEILKDIGPLNTLAENGFLSELIGPIAYNMKSLNDQLLIGFLRNQGRPLNAPTDGYKRQLRAVMLQDTKTERLATIKAATLALAGESDLVTPLSGMQKIAQAIPSALFYSFPNTGHAPHVEYTYDFNRLLLAHLEANTFKRA
ncbi:MAG: alpha/beta fold hydrolase [Chloroflexi bacterium]|uniref:Alpha/beta fold hydrolase n=1 Tax=Candidatus Chlorohelix allophototropha TaxID=3003348 RepID=A0A8T7LZ10_9CHLR|nr:alpha/beta fold hydrolase [Chloroflexota bacterium]WJW66624.1 alpha/beta hydrolase [Chloroflexota bacterium L227-S17]